MGIYLKKDAESGMKRMPENLVDITNLKFYRDEHLVFNKVNISVQRGKITAIMGPSGSGKSILLQSMITAMFAGCFERIYRFLVQV